MARMAPQPVTVEGVNGRGGLKPMRSTVTDQTTIESSDIPNVAVNLSINSLEGNGQ